MVKSIKIVPNPATDRITIMAQREMRDARIHILDSSGKTVFNCEHAKGTKADVNISALSSGYYFVSIEEENGTVYSSRFVKGSFN